MVTFDEKGSHNNWTNHKGIFWVLSVVLVLNLGSGHINFYFVSLSFSLRFPLPGMVSPTFSHGWLHSHISKFRSLPWPCCLSTTAFPITPEPLVTAIQCCLRFIVFSPSTVGKNRALFVPMFKTLHFQFLVHSK